ncbi:MAG TPA: MJ0042-type zinc finger domain-containing protein, partial [Dyella sp.]|uniref:MJ0042-type zinc finger domain-containing protein n=1 Tax=Dyella sp. TaxID=1869338 RepID=UPI002D7765E5
MYAQCPDCLTVFSLNTETLAQARGEVVCGHCFAEFDALASLSDQLPAEPFHQLPERKVDLPPRLDLAVYRPAAET